MLAKYKEWSEGEDIIEMCYGRVPIPYNERNSYELQICANTSKPPAPPAQQKQNKTLYSPYFLMISYIRFLKICFLYVNNKTWGKTHARQQTTTNKITRHRISKNSLFFVIFFALAPESCLSLCACASGLGSDTGLRMVQEACVRTPLLPAFPADNLFTSKANCKVYGSQRDRHPCLLRCHFINETFECFMWEDMKKIGINYLGSHSEVSGLADKASKELSMCLSQSPKYAAGNLWTSAWIPAASWKLSNSLLTH